jgi:hypothetical protein
MIVEQYGECIECFHRSQEDINNYKNEYTIQQQDDQKTKVLKSTLEYLLRYVPTSSDGVAQNEWGEVVAMIRMSVAGKL